MYIKSAPKILPWLTVISFLGLSYQSLLTIGKPGSFFNNMLATGGHVNIFWFLFNFGGAVVALITIDYLKKTEIYHGEYYILLQSSVLGMMLIAGAKDLIMVFVGLELMSLTFYILAGFARKRLFSNEAALKYFLLGAFATGFIVYGLALIYGSSQTLNIDKLYEHFTFESKNIVGIIGLFLFFAGFAFKIASVPFHMWVPDVYQGAPTSTTALMSTVGKAAAFSALIIVVSPAFGKEKATEILTPLVATFATLSMVYGSITAIMQTDIKRMLAYSSIVHAGYMLIGLAAGNKEGIDGVIFYLIAYSFMNLGAFGLISVLEGKEEKNLAISDYTGLGSKYPVLAGLLALFMFSLTGIPPFAAFFGKYYVFMAAIRADLLWLAIVGIAASAISLYFYLRVVVVMYFGKDESKFEVTSSNPALTGIIVSALLVILMGVLPGSIIDLIAKF
jgi:proton-translocating NADH-quinone oxidoreductase, chain N